VAALKAAVAERVFSEKKSGAKTDRAGAQRRQRRGRVLLVTHPDSLARSTRAREKNASVGCAQALAVTDNSMLKGFPYFCADVVCRMKTYDRDPRQVRSVRSLGRSINALLVGTGSAPRKQTRASRDRSQGHSKPKAEAIEHAVQSGAGKLH
jgi:hypothetical protein